MRRTNLLMGVVVIGLTAGMAAAPNAVAGQGGSITVTPAKGEHGATVAIVASCFPAIRSAEVVSDAIHASTLEFVQEPNSPGLLKGTGEVDAKVKPGKYSVSFKCNAVHPTTTFEVLPSTSTPPPVTTTKPPTTKPKPKPQVVVKPKAAPETGGGGTAD